MRFPPVSAAVILIVSAFAGATYAQTVQPGPTPERPALVRVELQPDPVSLQSLIALDLDIAYVGRRSEGVQVVADADDLAALLRSGLPYTVVYEDLVAHYQSRFDPTLSRDLDLGSMGGFYTFDEVLAKLDELRSNYPSLITARSSIGSSREGRPLWAVKISDNADTNENEPEAIIDCLTHAREPQGMMSTLYFMDWVLENYPADPLAKFLVEEREMWFVPVHNPDGYIYNQAQNPDGGGGWRKNRRHNYGNCYGVDLNRNWGYKWGYDNTGSSGSASSETYRGPSSMSEPETQAMAAFIAARGAVERMSIHTFGNMWLIPWCYNTIYTPDDALFRALAGEMAPPEYDIGTSWELLYKVNGGSLDYDYGQLHIMTFSPEMGRSSDGFWPRTQRIIPIAQQTLPSLQYFFAVAGSYVVWDGEEFDDASGGNGNGFAEPGETVALAVDLANRGLLDCGTPVVLNLATASPLVNITTASVQLAALDSRASASNSGQPFVLEIDPAAEHGDTYTLEMELVFDGASLSVTREFIIGVPRPLIVDTMESDHGWLAGAAGDTAETGAWERVDPNGTWIGDTPIQPENDATQSGTRCFITENGPPGGEPDANDLDHGFTTLVTPMFDLTGCRLARVGYTRWWTAWGASLWDRELAVDISNDGGATWHPLETTEEQNENAWIQKSFVIDSVVPGTASMRVRFLAIDTSSWNPEMSMAEAGIDDFWVEGYSTKPAMSLFGKLVIGGACDLHMAWDPGAEYTMYASPKLGNGIPMPGGIWYLPKPRYLIGSGTIPASGRATAAVNVPNNPSFVGKTFYFQGYAVPLSGGDPLISNYTSGVVKQ